MSYDAIFFVSFGGPEGPDDVMPFLRNVVRGRRVPDERLAEVAVHYQHFGGKSPINDQNRALIAAVEKELASAGIDLPVYFGNRNWHPLIKDTLTQMKEDGVKRALAFVTSGFSSYSGCRQYREHIAKACEEIEGAPHVDKMRVFYNHPGFVGPMARNVREALEAVGDSSAHVAFTAHSIPKSMAGGCDYQVQLEDACALVAKQAGVDDYSLVFQSRSGPPQVPWLEPDIVDHIESKHASGSKSIVVAPIGFISDHMEVIWDLDHEAKDKAEELGIGFARAKTVGVDPEFVSMIRELIQERLVQQAGGQVDKRSLGLRGPNHDVCPPDCCKYTPRRPGPPGGKRPGGTRPS